MSAISNTFCIIALIHWCPRLTTTWMVNMSEVSAWLSNIVIREAQLRHGSSRYLSLPLHASQQDPRHRHPRSRPHRRVRPYARARSANNTTVSHPYYPFLTALKGHITTVRKNTERGSEGSTYSFCLGHKERCNRHSKAKRAIDKVRAIPG